MTLSRNLHATRGRALQLFGGLRASVERRVLRAWKSWGPGRWSLRARLIGVVVMMLAIVSMVIGVISVFAMHSYLIGQVDEKLSTAYLRTRQVMTDPRNIGGQGFGLGQDPGTVIGRIRAGEIVGQPLVLASTGESGTVSGHASVLLTVPADAESHTRDLGGDLGKYRLRAIPLGDGSIAVTGLPLKDVDDATFRLFAVISAVALGGLMVAGALGTAVVRLTLRPLHRVAATAQQVSTMPLDRGEVALAVRVPEADTDPRTEVGQVGAALNAMLGHVAGALNARQASETRIRRFVADASHELRTPLAAIRGYAELSRRSTEPVPADVAHALSRVESQAVRMTGLVEDLLLLASLDAGRQVVFEPVDLSILLVGAMSDAHASGPTHVWKLELPEEPVLVLGEPARLTQVVVNLLANSRTHTPAGTAVTLTLSAVGPRAVMTVVDNGPGIPPSLLPEVFERFARGDSSRSRAAGSTGLGLSIVAAVVAAHHGTVAVDSSPGHTAFTVTLPLIAADGPSGAVQQAPERPA
ncbi:MAG TPA: HAMP domain-containing sensor histidine kinase [Sporichthyaceae bacterium]|nr:HAMP domain-containing sensor histidine kinase [Sporichthyaceae bacterium]